MASHKPEPTFAFLAENQIAVAKTLVIACADPRSDPSYILGLNFGGKSPLVYRLSPLMSLPLNILTYT
jgi:hypothetical protein